MDPLGVAPMLGAVALAGSAAVPAWRSGALLGLAGAMKFAPLAALPALFRLRGCRALGAAVLVPVLLYMPYIGAGSGLFDGLRTYADIWAFNGGLYRVLERLPGHPDLAKWIGASTVGIIAWRAALRRWPLERALLWTIGSAPPPLPHTPPMVSALGAPLRLSLGESGMAPVQRNRVPRLRREGYLPRHRGVAGTCLAGRADPRAATGHTSPGWLARRGVLSDSRVVSAVPRREEGGEGQDGG